MGIKFVYLLLLLLICLTMETESRRTEQLSVVTYNSQGHGPDRLRYISQLLRDYDFVFVQEHWLFNSNICVLENALGNATVHAVSGMNEQELLAGRPYGGVAIIWKNDLKHKVQRISVPSKRVCAVIICLEDVRLLLCNVYMPQNDSPIEYEETLQSLSNICFENNVDRIIIGGDMNVDTSRAGDRNLAPLLRFMVNEHLRFGTLHGEVDFTFESKINGYKSVIDYFLVSDNLSGFITEHKVRHEVDNMSDHSDLSISFSIPLAYIKTHNDSTYPSGPNWKRASLDNIEQYRLTLDQMLDRVNFSAHCPAEIERLHEHLVEACIAAGLTCIPHCRQGPTPQSNGIHGWNEVVREVRETAIFWHNLWKDVGSPRQGAVADIRRNTRAKYHLALKKLRADNEIAENNKLAGQLLESDSRSFWQQVNKMKGRKPTFSNVVDDKTDRDSIANLFADKYEALYSSVSYDVNEMGSLMDEMETMMGDPHCHVFCGQQAHVITQGEVERAIENLNKGKHEGKRRLFSDHLIHGTGKLHLGLATLFTAMLHHGYVPKGFRESTVFPIPKNMRKSLSDSENYRGITLSSILGKVLDNILLLKYNEVFSTTDMQFGFKAKSSTTQCTFVLNETIEYYKSRGSGVYTMLLDASKAFDRVHYIKLFRLLLKKGCCPMIARFLAILYTNQEVNVSWNGSCSRSFDVKNGIKQGGVLSPILFCVYVDELLLRLQASKLGCHIGITFVGALAYADDIVLIAPTRFALRKLLGICSEYSKEYHVSFNPNKSMLLYFGEEDNQHPFEWDGKLVNIESSAVHLGHIIGNRVTVQIIEKATNDLYAKTNAIMSLFGHCYSSIRYKLFKSYAMALYGAPLWDLSDRSLEKFLTGWRKCIRKLYKLPYRTHSNLLPLICEDKSPDTQMQGRFVKFITSCFNSKNSLVRRSVRIAMQGSRSNIGRNISLICNRYNIQRSNITNFGIPVEVDDGLLLDTSIIRDLIFTRDARDFTFFSPHEIRDLLDVVLT